MVRVARGGTCGTKKHARSRRAEPPRPEAALGGGEHLVTMATAGIVKSSKSAMDTYYAAKIEELEVEVRDKMLNLRRLEAQRNELKNATEQDASQEEDAAEAKGGLGDEQPELTPRLWPRTRRNRQDHQQRRDRKVLQQEDGQRGGSVGGLLPALLLEHWQHEGR